tara:strand:- start:69 stop:407 length:339 start_codon:yes stop_codon:yes gene_type:complete
MPNYGSSKTKGLGMIGRLLITGAGIALKGLGKAFKKGKKVKKVDKVQKSASAYVKRQKQISQAAGGPKPKKTVDPVSKRSGISKEGRDAIIFGTAAAAGLGASKTIKKRLKK